MYTNGVTLENIVNHVKRTLGIALSRDTVHRTMNPPRKNTHASKRYKGLINARVPPKRNTKEKKTHPDFHYTSAQVNIVNEMAFLCKSNTLAMSVDNKNKVEVGIPATSRRTNIRTFHLVDQAPDYHDHDFPNPNSKLVPAGYEILTHKITRSRSLSPSRKIKPNIRRRCYSETRPSRHRDICYDKLGRTNYKWPRCGPLLVQLSPSRAVESTNVMHMNHLMCQIKTERKFRQIHNVVVVADGGPDWSVKGMINFMSMGLLWKCLKLDCFIVQCYAPGHSRFNPIERLWSFLTNRIATVTLPDTIDGVKPALGDEKGWLQVLDNAVDLCARFWDGKRYCGFPINVKPFKSSDPVIAHIKKIHESLKDFSNVTKKRLEEADMKRMQETYSFLVKHANRKAYQLEFIRCRDQQCHHCINIPERENEFLEIVRGFGGSCPTPQFSKIYNGHYKNFLEMMRTMTIDKNKYNPTKFGSCTEGCSYLFFSEADKKRHKKLMKH